MLKFLMSIIISIIFVESARQIYKSDGELNIALLIKNCINSSDDNNTPYISQSLLASAIWTTQRLNFLNKLSPTTLNFGLQVYETSCTENDYFNTIFELYQQQSKQYLLGLISDRLLSKKEFQFSNLLDVKSTVIIKNIKLLYKTSTSVLNGLGWTDNVTVIAPDETILKEFYRYSKKEYICLRDCVLYSYIRNNIPKTFNISGPIVFFGRKNSIEQFSKVLLNQNGNEEFKILFVPIDGSVPKNLTENSFVIIPPHEQLYHTFSKPFNNIHPNPLLFEIAPPIINYANNVIDFIRKNCNETIYKMNCIRNKFNKSINHQRTLTPSEIIDILQIEPLKQFFTYDIYQVIIQNDTLLNNSDELMKSNNFLEPFNKVYSYNIFNENLTIIDDNILYYDLINSSKIEKKCFSTDNGDDASNRFVNGLTFLQVNMTTYKIRTDAWIFAFLSISLLGITFCLAILIFLLTNIFRRDIVLEGNPVLTTTLLLAIMLMFLSVLPFSLQVNSNTSISSPNNHPHQTLCLFKSLSVTLSYALVLSLILARVILLATTSKDIGFMSHISGPVQSFLCLFIFGVQAALNLQIIDKCCEIFKSFSFLYLMSYNAMLLLLLLCFCPLIYSNQRNYREGKYFTIAILLTICLWCGWIPCYIFLDEEWREPILCFSLLSTAMIFLGTIFIPRTYLMTIATARNKITNTLPPMDAGTSNNTLDIYRTQPVYDCVNIAAINAVTVARVGVPSAPTLLQQPDLYSCPALPDAEEFDFRCDSPDINNINDKVTRF